MEYRRLGKTGLMISAVGLGGHWKGLAAVLGRPFHGSGYDDEDRENIHAADFIANRHEVVSRAIELGVNYVDACSPPEVLAYSRALQGRRGAMLLGYSWHEREPRFPEWRRAGRLLEGLEQSLAEAHLECVDLWRISLPADGIEDAGERGRIEDATAGALALAKQQGKARFTGVSSHDAGWLRMMMARYPEQIEVVLFPMPAAVLDTARQHDTGVIAIKPFGGGALFLGDEDDPWRARLAIRNVLGSAVASTVPGCASVAQLENAVAASDEPRTLNPDEQAELHRSVARLPAWLRDLLLAPAESPDRSESSTARR